MNLDDLKSEFIPAIVDGFFTAMQSVSNEKTRGSGFFPSLTKVARVRYSFGPHRDNSGDITIFVTIDGYDIHSRQFLDALAKASGLRYLYSKRYVGRKATSFFATYSLPEIEKMVSGRQDKN